MSFVISPISFKGQGREGKKWDMAVVLDFTNKKEINEATFSPEHCS